AALGIAAVMRRQGAPGSDVEGLDPDSLLRHASLLETATHGHDHGRRATEEEHVPFEVPSDVSLDRLDGEEPLLDARTRVARAARILEDVDDPERRMPLELASVHDVVRRRVRVEEPVPPAAVRLP